MKTINFGIDLGTSNSLIAKFNNGNVEVFKNPNGFRETLPSMVAFRSDRILVGDQAKVYAEKDPKNVGSRFKRKMGTTENVVFQNVGSKTPVDLSAFVLKELKNFIHTGENAEAAVITIPASFDTVQSNATKSAGLAAGFKQVVLLQEPIAASLAFANKDKDAVLLNSQWMVYDLGGGTFDVALVRITEGELVVIDHEGDNYLGGTDLDAIIVEKLIVPKLSRLGFFEDLIGQMKGETGRLNRLWYRLLHAAETAKIELSNRTSADIDFGLLDLKDDRGVLIDAVIALTRSEFENEIRPIIDSTISMMRHILTRNNLQADDLKFVLMVGGSTYIPYVRGRVSEVLRIPVNTSIDPTNAVAVGAAYFAGGKQLNIVDENSASDPENVSLRFRCAYNRNSQEQEETFTAKVEGELSGLFYRIVGQDGAFDSGIRPLTARIAEDLTLRPSSYNIFELKVFDEEGRNVPTSIDLIQIAQGKYSVAGQMLPEDICLVTDDLVKRDTRLRRIFSKNSVLPSKNKISVEVARTVVRGTSDELKIIVVEGPAERHSSTNKPIGVLKITGAEVARDLFRGTAIDLSFEISESRDLIVSAYVDGTGQEFSQVFNGKERHVDVRQLSADILLIESSIQEEMDLAKAGEQEDHFQKMSKLVGEVQELLYESSTLNVDDVTDDKFKIEDRKRKIAQDLFELTSVRRLEASKQQYQETKMELAEIVHSDGNDRERSTFRELIGREQAFVNSISAERVEAAIDELSRIRFQILMRQPAFHLGMFENLVDRRTSMNDPVQSKHLIEAGRRHISNEAWDDLRQVNGRLIELLPSDQLGMEERLLTGIT